MAVAYTVCLTLEDQNYPNLEKKEKISPTDKIHHEFEQSSYQNSNFRLLSIPHQNLHGLYNFYSNSCESAGRENPKNTKFGVSQLHRCLIFHIRERRIHRRISHITGERNFWSDISMFRHIPNENETQLVLKVTFPNTIQILFEQSEMKLLLKHSAEFN